jgi:uncharacterized protein
MAGLHQEFLRRASRIPFLGLGLSVDVYSPDIMEVWDELQRREISIAYLEIFHAVPEALKMVRERLPELPLAYHAEGLWFTQPDWESAYASQDRLQSVARDLGILQAHWVNQECATKEVAGFAFGTYLPPLFTKASAEITAYHTWKAQQRLDQGDWGSQEESPLLLLECPPLSYFLMGDIPYAEFFARVTDMAPCGLVLDLGHVWTVYRYTDAWRGQDLQAFFELFLEQFPLERVIQIHIAGLDCHPTQLSQFASGSHQGPPAWIDAHEASIPEELLVLLARVVQEPRLNNLKGIALEVDNKPIPLLCREASTVREMLGPVGQWRARESAPFPECPRPQVQGFMPLKEARQMLTRQYRDYVELVTGKGRRRFHRAEAWGRGMVEDGLAYYATHYLPYEILSWGGDVRIMFPRVCELLEQHEISLNRFVKFWFAHSRKPEVEYDFFLLKIHVFVNFLSQVLPSAVPTAKQEADRLCQDYVVVCQGLRN